MKSYTGMAALFAPQYRVDHAGIDQALPITSTGGAVTIPDNSGTFIVNGVAVHLNIAGVVNHPLFDDKTNHVYADYNNGDPVFDIQDSHVGIDNLIKIHYAHIFKQAGSNFEHIQLRPIMSVGEIEAHYTRVAESADTYAVEEGVFADLTADYGLNITMTGGRVWAVNYEYIILDISVNTRLFNCSFYNGKWNYSSGKGVSSSNLVFSQATSIITRATAGLLTGGMVPGTKFKTNSLLNPGPFTALAVDATTIQTVEALVDENASHSITFWPQLDNLHYNDMTAPDGVGYLTNGQFTCNCIWRGIEDADHMYVMLDSVAYPDLNSALNAVMPLDLPQLPISHAKLVAKLVIEKGSTVPTMRRW